MELQRERMGGNVFGGDKWYLLSNSERECKILRNRKWPNSCRFLPVKIPGMEVTSWTRTFSKYTSCSMLKMRSSGHLHWRKKAIKRVRNSKSTFFAATPVREGSEVLKKSWAQMHCEYSSQSHSNRLAEEMTIYNVTAQRRRFAVPTLRRSGKRMRINLGWKQPYPNIRGNGGKTTMCFPPFAIIGLRSVLSGSKCVANVISAFGWASQIDWNKSGEAKS